MSEKRNKADVEENARAGRPEIATSGVQSSEAPDVPSPTAPNWPSLASARDSVPTGLRLRNTTLVLPSILLTLDLLVLESAFLCVYWARFLAGWFPVPKGIPDLDIYMLGSVGVLAIFLAILYANGMYDLRRRPSFADDITGLARSVLMATLLLAAGGFFYRGYSFSRSFVVAFMATSYVALLSGRLFARYLHLLARTHGVGLERVAILGRTAMQSRLLRALRGQPGLGIDVIGEILLAADEPGALPALGRVAQVVHVVERHHLDGVLVALPLREFERLHPVLESLADSQVRVTFVPDLQDLLTTNLRLQNVAGLPFLEMRQVTLTGIHRVFKRTFDLVLSGALAVLGMPLLLCIAAAVRLSSPGPVLFRQKRVGRDGRIFTMFKFRTMRADAERHTGPVFAVAGDPRRTPIGSWLRSTSLDELPQLYNVLRGDMSLVGPRPERPVFVEEFRSAIPRYFERHKVRSGITGWAQVNGLRGDTPLEERTLYDIYYVENWSLALDIKILGLTLRSVLSRRNAY
ncbi:MAG TPA: undecaprenyl-phosphate glucose phosphotransferase [Candidatus Krumholzibacteria bacterium]|nr:undecaprenyl-phosphate glucose phosphotransferase [Candidatus Krumholzibacteria bacterium]